MINDDEARRRKGRKRKRKRRRIQWAQGSKPILS